MEEKRAKGTKEFRTFTMFKGKLNDEKKRKIILPIEGLDKKQRKKEMKKKEEKGEDSMSEDGKDRF